MSVVVTSIVWPMRTSSGSRATQARTGSTDGSGLADGRRPGMGRWRLEPAQPVQGCSRRGAPARREDEHAGRTPARTGRDDHARAQHAIRAQRASRIAAVAATARAAPGVQASLGTSRAAAPGPGTYSSTSTTGESAECLRTDSIPSRADFFEA